MNWLARKTARILVQNSNKHFQEDHLRFGLELVLGAILQFFLILCIAALLGVGLETMVVLLAAALFRRHSGGAHCSAYYRCTLTSITVFPILGFSVRYFPATYLPYYLIALVIISGVLIYTRVPVDNPTRPITDRNQISLMKIYSAVMLVFLIIAALLGAYIFKQPQIAISIIVGVLWQTFMLTDWGHGVIHRIDRCFEYLEKSIKRKEGFYAD
jgi:accessory gene regulator B